MVRPSPTPAEMPGRLVIFGAAQAWALARGGAACSGVGACPITFLHPTIGPNPPLRLKVAYEGGIPVFTGADGGAAPSPLDPPGSGRLALCLAVPADAVDTIASVVLPLLAPGSIVFDVTSSKNQPLAALRARRDDLAVFGTHPLFGPRVPGPAGQSAVVCPDPDDVAAHRWLSDLFTEAGITVQEVSAAEHDRAMSWVQALTHQVLIVFAGLVSRSEPGMDELWRFRTPALEALAGLAGRVLTPSQDATIAAIQSGVDGAGRADDLAEAVDALRQALASGDGFRRSPRTVAAVQALRSDLAAARGHVWA
jgi:prephenate dehydrogenase